MDTQVKVIINSSINYRKIYSKELIINLKEYTDNNLGDKFIEFNEYERIELKFLSNNGDDFLEIDTYSDEEAVRLKPNESTLVSPGEDKDNMLVPGYYFICIKINNIIYKGMFKVKPSSIEDRELLYIRDYLNKIISGLAYNIYLERRGYINNAGLENIKEFEQYTILQNEFNDILSCVDYIIKDPIADIKKSYEIRPYSKKFNNKSQRWLNLKGQFYNNIYLPNKFYEKHSKITLNIKENIILKNILTYIYEVTINIEREYSCKLNNINKKILYKCNKRKELEERLIYVESNKNFSRIRKQIKNDIKSLKYQNKEYENELKKIKFEINKISKIRNAFCFYIKNTWINNISSKANYNYQPTMKLLKNKNYYIIYEVYKKLIGIDNLKNNSITFPFKKTSKLFEIYVYILIKDILESIGFKWCDGWIKSKEDNFNEGI